MPRRRLYYGWLVLAALAGINFANGSTAIGVLTVFVLPLTQAFGWSRTQIALATSLGALSGALAAPLVGRLTDRYGARWPLTLGGLLAALALFALARMQALWQFYLAFGLARFADQGCIQNPSPPVVARWFHRYRGRAMALLSFATAAGGVLLPPLAHVLITHWHWRTAWAVLGGLMLGCGVLPCAFLVRRQPQDLGLPLDGLAPAPGASAATAGPPGPAIPWRAALCTLTFWCLLAAAFVAGVAATGVALHLVPYLQQQGLAAAAAVSAVSLHFLAAGLSALAWGVAVERFSSQRLLVLAFALRSASLALLLAADTPLLATLFALVQGSAEGGRQTLTALLLADYYGRQHLGTLYGLLRAVQTAGFALGPLLAGATFDLTQSYRGAFAAFLALTLGGTLLVALARPPRQG
ncbi:MAG: MFS transporter [Candidatus Tectimicrobiota bacterium]|nr:MAG: MFS transporter [Candidatus Tectomicrobia bacterium]